MRKLLVVPALGVALLLGGCNGEQFSIFSAFVKGYCNVEPSIDDWARLRFPDQQLTEDILNAAAKAFCRQAVAQSASGFTARVASSRGGSREKVVLFTFAGRTARVRYTGTLRPR